MEIKETARSSCQFLSTSNIILCDHPKGTWHHSVGLHIPGSNSVALFPEEGLYLHFEGKIQIVGIVSHTALLKRIYEGIDATLPATNFSGELFALYQHLKFYSYILKRNNARGLMLDALFKLGYSIPTKKYKQEEVDIPNGYCVYKTKEELKSGKIEFKITLAPQDSLTFEELNHFKEEGVKLAIVKESKVVILSLGTI